MRDRIRLIVTTLTILLVVAALGSTAALASHAGNGTQRGGFEIDGDYLYPHAPPIAGATRDWQTIGEVLRVNDAFAPSSDSIFTGGSKEQDPDGWVFSSGSVPGKDDLTRLYFAGDVVDPTKAFLFLAFERLDVSGNGDVHVNFELNQSSATVTNSKGTVIPRRSSGDLLVVYDYDGGTASTSIDIEIRLWVGDALSGQWGPDIGGADAVGDVNGAGAVTRPAESPFGGGTVDAKRFGEVAINLLAIYPNMFTDCVSFTNFWAKTRASGESFDSALKDRTASTRVEFSSCPDVPSIIEVEKKADNESVGAGNPIGYTITVTNTGDVVALGVRLTDDLPAGEGLVWSVDGGSAASDCAISARMLECALGDMPAGASRTVHVASPTTAATCGRLSNKATATAVNGGSDTSPVATVDVMCAAIAIVKTVTPVSGAPGDPVTYSYRVTNTGSTTLLDLSVDDDKLGHIGDIGRLDAGQSVTLTKASTLGSTGVTNVGCVEGTDEFGSRARACDDATVVVVLGSRFTLPATGIDAAPASTIAAVLVFAGLTFLAAARRREVKGAPAAAPRGRANSA
ncbi:MAG TPA: hypothetical protein VM841_02280 [Actinomycetota bacterium]|nr:hypothetical protein [Actinomycetota bacterium]